MLQLWTFVHHTCGDQPQRAPQHLCESALVYDSVVNSFAAYRSSGTLKIHYQSDEGDQEPSST